MQLPFVPDLADCSICAEDFETACLNYLFAKPLDFQTLQFVTDFVDALGGEPDLSNVSKEVRDIFAFAVNMPQDACINDASRERFCAHYHDHVFDESC